MHDFKRLLSIILDLVMMLSMIGMKVMSAKEEEVSKGYIEISLDDIAHMKIITIKK